MSQPDTKATQEVKKYYDYNTPRFLSYGTQRITRTIHRPVWGSGVEDEAQALHYVHELVLQEAYRLQNAREGEVRVVDLGSGVGASLFYLAGKLGDGFSGVGVTISPLQARMAAVESKRDQQNARCVFVIGDFSAPPFGQAYDLVFSIEALAHSDNPPAYFRAARQLLRPGGRLVLCDDFLSEESAAGRLNNRQRKWLQTFQLGWGVPALLSPRQARELGESSGLRMASEQDLTAALRLRPPPAALLSLMASIVMRVAHSNYYWRSVVGGQALQTCLAQGLVTYRSMVFERSK